MENGFSSQAHAFPSTLCGTNHLTQLLGWQLFFVVIFLSSAEHSNTLRLSPPATRLALSPVMVNRNARFTDVHPSQQEPH